MALTAKCSKCNLEADVVFSFESGKKLIACDCGHVASASGLGFNPKPKFLFKYRPHDHHSESWILNEELFFASPSTFNDPFDSKVMHTFEGTNEQKARYLSAAIEKQRPGIEDNEKRNIINSTLAQSILDKNYDGHIERMQKVIDGYAVLSLSKKAKDLLMFAYYARDHSGYCLKYRRTAENILSMAEQIDYRKSHPKFSVFEVEPRKLGDNILLTKAQCWKHEQEWRVGFETLPKRVVKSPHPVLEGIILGCNMKPEQRQEIVALNQRRSRPVEIFRARKKKFEFALEILPLNL